MSDACQCAAAGFCPRRNANIPNIHWQRCQQGHVEVVDHLYSVTAAPAVSGPRPVPGASADVAPKKKCKACGKRK